MLVRHSKGPGLRFGSLATGVALVAGALSIANVAPAHAAPTPAAAVGAVYVTNTTGEPGMVSQFGIDTQGLLAPLTPGTVGSGLVPVAMAVNPRFKSAYSTNFDDTISQYDIDPVTGALSPKTPASIASGGIPTGVAVSPDGKSVYVSNDADNDVSMYDVDPSTGALAPKTPATVAAGREPSSVAVTPDGRSVYVSNASDNTVRMYDVDASTGVLTPKTPATVAGDGGPRSVAIAPNGRSAYVTNSNQGDNSVSQYDINPTTGVLSPKVPATVAAGAQPEGMIVAPDGKSAYVADIQGSRVSQYDIDPVTGALTPKTPATVASTGPINLAMSPDANSVYVTEYLGAGVAQYDVDPQTGTLSPKTPAAVATGSSPEGVAVVALPLVTQPTPPVTASLNGVSCVRSNDCVAVGSASSVIGGERDNTTLIEHFDGRSWSVVASPNPGLLDDVLEGVSCTGPRRCVAVGYSSHGLADASALIETWNGSVWSVTPTPATGHAFDFLRAVSCVDATNCVAVGNSEVPPNGFAQTLVETWNGRRWTLTASPDPGTTGSSLLGVSCTRRTTCVAVGFANGVNSSRGLIETWNGIRWSVTPSPTVGDDGTLAAVSCSRPWSCTAVGADLMGTQARQVSFAERWDGRRWYVTPTRDRGRDALEGVSCPGIWSCAAVGISYNGVVDQTLTQIWRIFFWSLSASPSPNDADDLHGVFCTRSIHCVAVGQTFGAANASQGLIETWNGRTWSVAPRLAVSP